ncbi:MAG: hypothetical protein ACK5HT_18075, partial [Draconibacterium sp.]
MNSKEIKTKVNLSDIQQMVKRYHLGSEAVRTIENENLLPPGLIQRLHNNYPKYSGFFYEDDAIFKDKEHYSGLKGFREIVQTLKKHGIELTHIKDREFFIEVYRFLATRYVLNTIDWKNYESDSNYQLVFPQPGMIHPDEVKKYADAPDEEAR